MFSVIIPTFNRETEISKALISVISQTYKRFEIIIIDNGSTDNTQKIIKNFKDEFPQFDIKYFFQENTGSPAGSRNTGIRNAKHSWIAFLDSDDTWEPNKLKLVYEEITNSTSNFIAVGHWEFQSYNKKITISKLGQNCNSSQYIDLLLNGNRYSTSTMVVRKEFLERVNYFDERKSYFGVEDYKMWMDLSKLGLIHCIQQPLSTFYQDSSSFSGDVELHTSNLKQLVTDEIKFNYSANPKLIRKHAARIDYYHGRALQLRGDKKAVKILIKSIISYPYSIKKYIALLYSLIGIKR